MRLRATFQPIFRCDTRPCHVMCDVVWSIEIYPTPIGTSNSTERTMPSNSLGTTSRAFGRSDFKWNIIPYSSSGFFPIAVVGCRSHCTGERRTMFSFVVYMKHLLCGIFHRHIYAYCAPCVCCAWQQATMESKKPIFAQTALSRQKENYDFNWDARRKVVLAATKNKNINMNHQK